MGLGDKCDMSWVVAKGRPGRWKKVYRGKEYYFAPGGTKESTYQQANAWWRTKRAELDAPPAHPHADRLAELDRRAGWAERHGEPTGPIRADMDATRALRERDDDPAPLDHPGREYLARLAMLGIHVDADADPDVVAMALGNRRVHADRAKRDDHPSTPADRTIKALAERYVDREKVRCDAGEITVGTWSQERGCLHTFRDWVGPDQDVNLIDASKYEGYWAHLSRSHHSIDSRKRHLRIAKQFIGWLAEMGLITPPSNLASRRYRFKGESKPIATMDVDTVTTLIREARGQLRLHMLLMLNCGATQVDITDLHPGEVDWQTGAITRRRSKATRGGYSKAPAVTWRLWPETFRLLKEHGRRDGDRVLVTEDGTPWTYRRLNARGQFAKTDNVMSAFRRLVKRLEKSHPGREWGSPSELRATASTMLDNHPEHGRYAQHFLGHSPRSVAASNYVVPSQERFDEAVRWLGLQYGFVDGR